MPLQYSRNTVSNAVHGLSPWISHLTCIPGCTPFTPSKSGQRLPPTYYRGCWHVVSRGLFKWYRLLLFPLKRSLQPESLLPSRGVAGSGLRPLPNIPRVVSQGWLHERWRARFLASHLSCTWNTDVYKRQEYSKANGRRVVKELGKLTP